MALNLAVAFIADWDVIDKLAIDYGAQKSSIPLPSIASTIADHWRMLKAFFTSNMISTQFFSCQQ